jgi:F-type H+-transporting ATPase subunit b
VRDLRAEMGTLAVSLAEKIVGESLEDEVRRKGTVERFLADLETTSTSGAGVSS